MKLILPYNNIEDLPDHVLYEALLVYRNEYYRRKQLMDESRKIIDEEDIYDGPIGKMGTYPSEKNEKYTVVNDLIDHIVSKHKNANKKEECKNEYDVESLRKQVNFWKSGYFRLSGEIKQMLDQKSSDKHIMLELHNAKETIDYMSDKLIRCNTEIKRLKGIGEVNKCQ